MATPMMEQFDRIKREHPDHIIFFRMGDFFEMFKEDAVEAHSLLNITLTKRNHGKGKSSEIPLAGFPHHQLEAYLAKMNRAGKRVVVVDQVEDPKQAKGLVKRDVVRIVTAGTNLSDEAFADARNQYLVAVIPDGKLVGLAVCDVTTGEFTAGSLSEDRLKDRIDLLHPKELLCREEDRDEVRAWLPENTMLTPLPDWIFGRDFATETLTSHFKVQTLKGFGLEEDYLAVSAAGAALHYIKENLRTDPTHFQGLSRLPLDDFLVIDAVTRRNLELIEPLRTGDESSTLFAHVDKTVTPFGRRMLVQHILRPLLDKKQIEVRLDGVEELISDNSLRDGLRKQLGTLSDMERLVARLTTRRSTPRDAAALRDTLSSLPGIITLLADVKTSLLRFTLSQIDPLNEFTALLKHAIAEAPPAVLAHGGAIAEGYNEELDELRNIARGGKEFIQSRQEEERERTGISSLSIGYNRVFGYYIEVSKANQDRVPDDYIRKQTLVNAERFITPDLKVWEEKIVRAEEDILELERSLFEEICAEVSNHVGPIQRTAHALSLLDVLSASAELAISQRYTRPRIVESGLLTIVRGRHPVIENLLPTGESFIANDLEIGDEKRQIALVTGPNMGGKSTYLRQVGLIVLMAHSGMYVPADIARIPLTDRVFTRVGASDNLARGESTFLVEMHEAANILHNCSGRSLILFDEIGRGTSTFDGLSLAWAMVEYLHGYSEPDSIEKPKVLFATHYHELTELESVLERVFNLHVEVREWGERIIFLRKVLPGRSGASYGIEVARLAGVPKAVIDRATEVLKTLEATEFTDDNLPRLAKPITREITRQHDPLQLQLFTVEERAVRDELANFDLNNMTPLEALRLLAELKEKYGTDSTTENTE
ncbi:MAG TPA: DNA mismatch repair protein MutS [Bacteroidetes bacterium]|nr:DNA mismatch repair protein MutS [bacterium BMS3Bbin04]HDO65736.1 DNA mismatch repair protein MutS [Bacteroidota bacterium]HEX04861.1 DNA mismatch repair protein MutS [Bacteroidota bacterium]